MGEASWSERLQPTSGIVALIATVFGIIDGSLAGWATFNLGASPWAFLLVGIGVVAYLWHKPNASMTVGSALYVTALILILLPLVFYIPMLVGSSPQTAYGVGMFIGSFLGLVLWGFVFFLIALVVATVGYFFKRRGDK